MSVTHMITIPILAFFCEYMDSTLGMGYGTTLTPVLLLMGFDPLEIVPAILLSELITGTLAAVAHHKFGNVDFSRGSRSLHVALLLGACSIVGVVGAVFVAVNVSKTVMSSIIGAIILSMGLIILFFRNREFKYSWKRITTLGVVASFNKGMSGGGYGPLLVGGQVLSGVSTKNAIGITQLAEALTCLTGVLLYVFAVEEGSFHLAPWLIMGAVLSVVPSAWTVKKVVAEKMTIIVGVATVLLGVFTFLKVFNVI